MLTGLKTLIAYRQKIFKLNIIQSAAKLFKLSKPEEEQLASKAGFALYRAPYFNDYLNTLIYKSCKKYKTIYDKAIISDRMFRRMKADYHPTKTSLLALALSLELKTSEIYILLKKAGYVLSEAIAFDMVIKWLLEQSNGQKNLLLHFNEVLYALELPLLMTREKS